MQLSAGRCIHKGKLTMDYCKILKESKNIAVVGLSGDPSRISRKVAAFLVSKGYNLAGINPAIPKADNIPVYNSLRDVPFPIDIINVFRKPETINELLNDILLVKPKVLWLQEGIINNEVIDMVQKYGIIGIQNKCILTTHINCF